MEGVINLLKTPGMTSHDCVYRVRRLLKEKRVGHTGTLDPLASGVLPICVGKATRLAEYSMDYDKTYRAEMLLGLTSDTQDITGEIQEGEKVTGITQEQLLEAFASFVGSIQQVTPAYSAAKHKGKKLYELARQGEAIPEKIRDITIHEISLFRYYPEEEYPRVIFDVVCSKGTYIRTLCADLGQYLGTGALMSFLVRTGSGPFLLSDTVSLEEIAALIEEGKDSFLIPMGALVQDMPVAELNPGAVEYIKNGRAVDRDQFTFSESFDENDKECTENTLVRLEHKGRLIAIGTVVTGKDSTCIIKPKKVLV